MSSKWSDRLDAERIWSTATRLPKNLDKGSLLKYTLTGSGLAALITALATKDKNKRLRNALIAAAIGGGLGAYANVLKHNIVTELGGHFDENPDYYDPEKLISKLDPKDKKVLLYVMGAADLRGGKKASENRIGPNAFKFAFGDTEHLVRAVNAIPSDYKVDIVGHSAGGGTVLQALRKLKRNVNSVALLDAVDLDPLGALTAKLSSGKKPKNVDKLVNFVPANYNIPPEKILKPSDSDYWVDGSPLRIGPLNGADKNITVVGDNHSMLKTGLRWSGNINPSTVKAVLNSL